MPNGSTSSGQNPWVAVICLLIIIGIAFYSINASGMFSSDDQSTNQNRPPDLFVEYEDVGVGASSETARNRIGSDPSHVYTGSDGDIVFEWDDNNGNTLRAFVNEGTVVGKSYVPAMGGPSAGYTEGKTL